MGKRENDKLKMTMGKRGRGGRVTKQQDYAGDKLTLHEGKRGILFRRFSSSFPFLSS